MKHNCTRCGELLKENTEVWLELDSKTNLYHKPGEVPEEKSQGLFAFGKRCAKVELTETLEHE